MDSQPDHVAIQDGTPGTFVSSMALQGTFANRRVRPSPFGERGNDVQIANATTGGGGDQLA